jgi:glucokinase
MSGALAIGIDLGGTQLRAGLVDPGGRLVRRAAVATDVSGGPRGVLAQMRRLVREIASDDDEAAIAGIGVSSPGPLDTETGTVLSIPTLPGWEDFPLREAVSAAFGRPVVLENDGIAAAAGEGRFGAARGLRHFVYVTVSTGIGGGVMVDGRLLRGRRGMAGHVGHMILDREGPLCGCGARGCFEALASGSALGKAGREVAASDPSSRLGAVGEVTARHVVEAAREGDRAALDLIDREAGWLGIGFAGLAHLYSPQAIIVGGGLSQAFDLLRAGVDRAFGRSAMPAFRDVAIIPAALGDDAGLVGAASLVLHGDAATA